MISMEFLVTALVVVLLPGTGVIYTVSSGLFRGKRHSIAAAVGCTLGIVPHLAACILGLSALMNMGARVFFLIRVCGSLYLLYLAWSMWNNKEAITFKNEGEGKNYRSIVLRGICINLLNPKLTLFFFSFLPQFVPRNTASTTMNMMVLSLVFMLMTLLVFVCYGIFASVISKWMRSTKGAMGIMQKSFSVLFAGMALKLALSDD